MRDYNSIQFKSPRKVKDHPLVVEDEKKEGSSASTAPSTPPVPAQRKQPVRSSQYSSPGRGQGQGQQHQSSSSVASGSTSALSQQDALNLRREGAEATIHRLRSALDESSQKDTTAKAALAKSDAVILELRSSVRQLKRQLEKVQQEKEELEQQQQEQQQQSQQPRGDGAVSEADSALDARVGELQVQLDRAHAQILTADMVRKELEDTLEAEQYTWELRVQDQERQIQELQQDCATLVADLEGVRGQWKESDEKWSEQVEELKNQLEKAQKEATHLRSAPKQSDSEETGHLREKLRSLESERTELQGCLDEALKELEAVDAELQGDPVQQLREENEHLQEMLQNGGDSAALAEPLQHLYRMVLERDGIEDDVHSKTRDARSLISAIQSHIDRSPPQNADLTDTRQRVRELEGQLSVYKGDLQAREESTQELRASLKEAVSLLKPLQDAVGKADREKASLQKQIQELKQASVGGEQVKELQDELQLKEKEIEHLREEVETLEMALTRAKAMAASSAVAASKASASGTPDSVEGARAKLRQRRAEEDNIRKMLKDAQSRFHSLHEQNQEAESRNFDLQNRLDSQGKNFVSPHAGDTGEEKKEWERDSSSLQDLRDELTIARGELSRKEVEMRNLEQELEEERYKRNGLGEDDAVGLREARSRVEFLEGKLDSTSSELKAKKESEKALNASLKEALNLLRPLQAHLEEAEREKRAMAKELMALKKRNQGDSSTRNTSMPSEVDVDHLRELEYAVQQLEKENSQLHDALEDMSQSINASHLSGTTNLSQKNEAKLREELVEMKSRCEVTQSRLEDAFVENHTLVEALQKREKEEKQMVEELHLLRQRLKQSQSDLERSRSGQSGGGSTFSGHSQSSRERTDRHQAPPPGSFPYGTNTVGNHRARRNNPNYWE